MSRLGGSQAPPMSEKDLKLKKEQILHDYSIKIIEL
jgi:hypothetical protein